MSLAACIIRCPQTTRCPMTSVSAGRHVTFQHRGGCLLELQEQRVVLVATLEQDDVGQGADAADAHDLAGHVDGLEPFQQVAVIVAEGGPVGTELLAQEAFHVVARNAVGGFEVPCRDDDRWLADDPVLARGQLGKLRQRLQAVARASLCGLLACDLPDTLGRLGVLLGLWASAAAS
jgi:hypothetical protein